MPSPLAAVLEPQAAARRAITTGLTKAGIKLSRAETVEALGKEGLVVLGPSVKDVSKLARQVRKSAPRALVLAARKAAGEKISGVDGVLPLPISAPDLRLRLPELEKLKRLSQRPAKAERAPAEPPAAALPPVLDPLTHFYTFQHFKELLFVEVKRARRYGFPISLGLIAFDPPTFEVTQAVKAQLLGGLALAVRRSLRDTDFPVIDPNDRIILLMPHTDLQGALVVCKRICERVARASLPLEGRIIHPTISSGVAAAPLGGEISFSDLARQAQGALDIARSAGGNQVALPLDEPTVPSARPLEPGAA